MCIVELCVEILCVIWIVVVFVIVEEWLCCVDVGCVVVV